MLRSFGLDGPVRPVPGGQGTTWRCADAALKPAVPGETEWAAPVLAALAPSDTLRVPEPLPGRDGWTVDGWSATRWVPGRADQARTADIIRAGEDFAALLADVPPPGFLRERDDPWAVADRMAWQEQPLPPDGAYVDLVERLAGELRPVPLGARLMHPDLKGNVLFHPGLPPAVIDWPPYLRPVAWGSALVAVDTLDTDASRLDVLAPATGPHWRQLLIRAELYRLCVKNEAARRGIRLVDDKTFHRETTARLIRLPGR
ncbi:TIGR02569 family protein [Kitasatospora sp. NPDC097643]|uniref:TIGR02569 family protein n=1 Tax=Kitasatospora sp. NPDC097643 TaxID=3157230 RepID=UPI003316C976